MSNFCLLKITRKSHISFSTLIGLAEGSASEVVSIISVIKSKSNSSVNHHEADNYLTRLAKMRFNLTFTDGRVHGLCVSVMCDNVPLTNSACILELLNGTVLCGFSVIGLR